MNNREQIEEVLEKLWERLEEESGTESTNGNALKEEFVVPLTRLKPGETGTIAYIKTGDSKKLQKLMVMGVLPGNAIELNANFPSFVFSVGYSQYAVDADMAATIVIKRG